MSDGSTRQSGPLSAIELKCWGTTPGINFIDAHLNRIIVARERSVLAIIGPGHGGPALVADHLRSGCAGLDQ